MFRKKNMQRSVFSYEYNANDPGWVSFILFISVKLCFETQDANGAVV